MSTKDAGPESAAIESRDQLVALIEKGEKPVADWRIGTEHEKFNFYTSDLSPVPYEGERGVRALLQQFVDRFGWEPIMEGRNVIGLKQLNCPKGGAISLEPGGQFELSGAPLENVHRTCTEVHQHLAQARQAGDALGIGFLGLGFTPNWRLDQIPRMPKGRYAIMTRHMPRVGGLGLDMMYRTCTVQVNLDFSDEADMVRKFRVGLALQPLATALFANSPFMEGRPNGFLSYRSEVWRDTDNQRSGMASFVFEPGMGYERYVDYALDVPMYFVYRDGKYIDVAGSSFRDFLDGKLAALPGERPRIDDFSDHLTTLFPEVRLKQFLEMRGADGGPWRRLCALPAFWTGLFYDAPTLDAAWTLVKDWTNEERQGLRDTVPRLGLRTPFRGRPLLAVARKVVALSLGGLRARERRDSLGQDERQYLASVEEVVATGNTPAELLLAEYETDWNRDTDRVFLEHAY